MDFFSGSFSDGPEAGIPDPFRKEKRKLYFILPGILKEGSCSSKK
jgi:hypothetical protein